MPEAAAAAEDVITLVCVILASISRELSSRRANLPRLKFPLSITTARDSAPISPPFVRENGPRLHRGVVSEYFIAAFVSSRWEDTIR